MMSRLLIFTLAAFLSTNILAYEVSLHVGFQTHSGDFLSEVEEFDNQDNTGSGFRVGISIKNNFGKNKQHFLGAGLDLEEFLGDPLLGIRALDYQYRLNEKWRVGAFFGAASLDNGLPQNGLYMGANANYFFAKNFSLGIEIRNSFGLGRDSLLEDDPQTDIRPDFFTDVFSSGLQIHWHF